MRVGPSESACRSRHQTTFNCCGNEPGGEILTGDSTPGFQNAAFLFVFWKNLIDILSLTIEEFSDLLDMAI